MQRVAPPQETHTMVVGNMQQHFSPKNGWCSTSRSTAAFGLVMTKISGASRNQRNLLILISHSLGLFLYINDYKCHVLLGARNFKLYS
jgi:hypothetical protein